MNTKTPGPVVMPVTNWATFSRTQYPTTREAEMKISRRVSFRRRSSPPRTRTAAIPSP